MTEARDKLLADYASALKDSLDGGGEAALHRAYELGRQAIADGLGVLDVAAVHHEAFAAVLSRPSSAQERERTIAAIGALFAECLSCFEMNQRGYRESLEELRRQEQERGRLLAESAKAEALARSNAELREFARVVAHDLQEPLRTVMSSITAMIDGAKKGADQQSLKLMSRAVQGARRMSGLIESVLAYSRVETQGLPFEPTDSETALLGALANLRAAIEQGGATVTHDALPTVLADPSQLIQLFQNLICNAVKFRGGAPARVHVSARRRGQAWTFCVRDNGIGFDARDSGRIFMLFQRLNPKLPGHGIGLAICKKIVERHGGEIKVASSPGKGSIFHFSLPAAPARRGASNDAGRLALSAGGRR